MMKGPYVRFDLKQSVFSSKEVNIKDIGDNPTLFRVIDRFKFDLEEYARYIYLA